MKLKRILATLILLTTLTACAPSAEPSVEPSAEPTAAVEMNYYRYTSASSFYPLWAQPNSEFTVTKTQYGTDRKFTVGGYLERENIEGREDIAAVGLYSTAAEYFATPNSKALYDENGHICEILYLYSDGEYHAEPPEGEDVPTLPPEETVNIAHYPLKDTDVGSVDMSYEEYFSVPRYVEAYYNTPRDMTYRQLYEMTPEIEEILSQYDIISLVHGNQIVLFFMTSDYKIYRLHVPSGTVDFMCDTAFDFDTAQTWHTEYRRRQEYNRRTWYEEDEEEYARLEALSYEEWLEENETEEVIWHEPDGNRNPFFPDSGYFEVLSNNDVRFTVLAPDWQPTDIDIGYNDTDWFSHIIFGTGSYFYGDYVTYSAALDKFGATDRALDLLGIPEEQRMTFDEFCDYYGGTPPHSGI